MQVGEVKVAEDADFSKLRTLCDENDGWKRVYNKNGINVWTRSNDESRFDMIKIHSSYDVGACTLYDVLLDPQYRKLWDPNMIESFDLCCLNPNNDIGYYCMRCPAPLKNRDFVVQRSWLETGSEYIVINHSVNHEQLPPKKGIIRGISHFTGYLIRPTGASTCQLHYVTQSDPKGNLPSWLVNKLTNIVAPKIVQRLHKASKNYETWKRKHQPNYKPWLYPEQMTLPRVDMAHIKTLVNSDSADSLEEGIDLKEEEFTTEDLDKELKFEIGD